MNVLIACYSRTGTTKKAAEAIADALHDAGAENVEIEQIVDTTSREGLLGYLRSGRDAVLKRFTALEPLSADVASFDLVVIGTPIWGFTVSAPVRTFCAEHGREAKQLAFFCTMGGSGDKRAFQAMESLCEKAPVAMLVLMERDVKRDHQQNFRDKVQQFAEAIAAT